MLKFMHQHSKLTLTWKMHVNSLYFLSENAFHLNKWNPSSRDVNASFYTLRSNARTNYRQFYILEKQEQIPHGKRLCHIYLSELDLIFHTIICRWKVERETFEYASEIRLFSYDEIFISWKPFHSTLISSLRNLPRSGRVITSATVWLWTTMASHLLADNSAHAVYNWNQMTGD